MIRESNPSPTADARSAPVAAGQPPADLPQPAQACCSGCGARLRSGARFCSDCGAAHGPPPDEAEAIHSQFGGSSADLAELLSARGHVVSCPRCDELNNASAAYCRHCGLLLAAAGASRPVARRGTLPALRYGPVIALLALLGVTAAALWLGRSPTEPVSEATHSTGSRIALAAPPVESVVSAAPIEPVAPSPAPGASGEEQETTSPSVSSPGAAQKRVPASERKKVSKTAVLRASAPTTIDELYRQRAAKRCEEGLPGLICRQRLRFELCSDKWTQDTQSGMEICRLNG